VPPDFLNTTHSSGVEQDFTVVWWEQRGAALSHSPDIPPASMIVAQLIADTIAVTHWLRQRFGKDRIILEVLTTFSVGRIFADRSDAPDKGA
jgi:hypothetical protein